MKVSVVIPTHNRPAGVQDALASLLKQTVLPDEVVVVDDGSQEPVPKTIFDFFPAEVEVKLLRNEKPMGGNNARNRGVLASKADYVAFLDDDDTFLPNKMEEVKASIETCNGLTLLTSYAEVNVQDKYRYTIRPESNVDFKGQLVSNMVGATSMVVVNRAVFIDAGMFDEKLLARQDYEAWLRVLKKGVRYRCIAKKLVRINVDFIEKSTSKSIDRNKSALSYIDGKYAESIAALERHQVDLRQSFIYQFLAHKYLVTGDGLNASKYFLKSFGKSGKVKALAASMLALLGRSAFFCIYTKMEGR